MKPIGISNIAWTAEEDEAAHALLASLGVTSLELVPTRHWPALDKVPTETARTKAEELRDNGFAIASFQAILFGQPDLVLFDASTRPALKDYLRHVADLCAAMGAKAMVFGAPKNRRVPDDMPTDGAREIAVEFFRELGTHAASLGVSFGLEANPAAYGCNFCTHVGDVAEIVRAVDSPGLRWHLDTGEMAMNSEDVNSLLAQHGDLVGSMHISQPNLDAFTTPWPGHGQVAQWLSTTARDFPISIEMKRQPAGLTAVEETVQTVREIYG